MPFFSVIIPTYNRAKLIGGAIESVFAQTFDDHELIVVDDGSTDDTAAVLSGFGGRVRVIRQANAGPGAARNAGIAQASGEYVVFLDSDDLYFPWSLATYREAIERADRPALVMGAAMYWSDAGELPGVARDELQIESYADYFASADRDFLRTACVIAVRTDALRDVRGFTTVTRVGEDHDLLFRLGVACGFMRICLPVVVAYRQHDSISKEIEESHKGIAFRLDEEDAGRYPGGDARRRERVRMLSFASRVISWGLLHHRMYSDAWRLYRRTLRWQWRLHWRYALAFPVALMLSRLGLWTRGGARGRAS